jgi:RNA polymerase sigma-70 factor (ECF subfamily)
MNAVVGAEPLVDAIAAAVGGDEVAFARIVAAHHDDMVRVCFLVTADVDLAQEAAHLAWPIAWRRLRTLRDAARLRAWLVTVAANEARHLLKRRRVQAGRVKAIDVTTWEALPDPNAPTPDVERMDLLTALQALQPDDRTIVAMRYGLGMSSTEIGRAIGMSPAGIRSRLARALKQLRQELEDA